MECNRDEAERAKQIAEKKFLAKDVAGAKKFASKAWSLYPCIDGISQLLATIDVFVYADNKINGEIDWYGVLGVNPLDDEDVIRKKYRKLVLMLHPDKNKANGANEAFLLVSQAWDLLSDKTRRSAYDSLTSPHRFQHNVQPQCNGSATPAAEQNGFHSSAEWFSDVKVPNWNSGSVHSDFHKKKTASHDPPKPPNVPPASKKEKSAVPPSSHKQKPANASDPPAREYKPKTVPPSFHKHNRRTAPPASSYKEKTSTFPPSPKHKSSKMPGSYHEQKPQKVPVAPQKPNHGPHPPQERKNTASCLSTCHGCKNQYYCPRIYINQDLLCRDCFNEVFHGRKPC